MSRQTREHWDFEEHRLAHFVDREPELGRAEEVLSSPPGTALPVLVFHGVGGMGKTALLEKIRADLCGWRPQDRDREAELPHAWVDFSSAAAAEGGVRSRTGMLHHIKRELDGYGLQFPRFELVWARYRELLTGQAFQPATASKSEFGALLEAATAAGGTFGSVVRLLQLLGQKGVRWYEEWRHGKLAPEGIEQWQHAYEATEALPKALAADIAANLDNNEAEESYRSPVLFFDSLEWLEDAGEEGSLTVEVIQELCEYLPQVPVMIGLRMGERGLPLDEERLAERGVEEIEVGLIPDDDDGRYRKECLELRGVREESWDAIIEVAGGHALWMGIAADIALDVQDREGRPVTRADLLGPEGKREELLERLLERLGEDRPMKETVRAACVCRWFDYELLEAVRAQTDDFAGQFRDLGGLSFVIALERDEDGRIVRAEIHQTVRELVLGGMRRQDLQRLARRGAERCEGQGEGWEAEGVYFLMLADPEEGLAYGGELFDRVNFEWNRALGEEVLAASRDGWHWRHIGEAARPEDPWHFASFEAHIAKMEGNPSGALRAHERAVEGTRREGDRHGEGLVLNSMAIIHRQQGRYEEAMGLHEQALDISRELGDRRGAGVTLNNMASVHLEQGRYEDAMGLYEQSLAIKRELGDRQGEGVTLNNMAGVHQRQGRYEDAMGLYEQSLAIKRELGDRHGEGQALNNTGEVYRQQGRYEEAMGLYEQSLAISRELGDRHGEGATLNNMAIIHEAQGRYEEAMALYRESLDTRRELGDRHGEGETLNNMANVHQRQGRYEQAMGLYEQSLEIMRELGDRSGEARSLWGIAMVDGAQGRYRGAMEGYEEAVGILRELGDRHGEGQTLNNMAILHRQQGRYEEAMKLYERSLEISQELEDRHGEAQTLNNIANVHLQQGRHEEAMALYEQGLEIRRDLGDRHGEGQTLMNMGVLEKGRGNLEKAREYWEEALKALEGLGVPEEDKVRAWLEELGNGE